MENWINVLSLFDWMSCWMITLDKLWIKVNNYFSSEINKKAIQVSKSNYDNIIYIWDITKVRYWNWYLYAENWTYRVWKIHLIIWWSPCQWFSRAWAGLNFNDPRSKLFFEYTRLLKEINPEYFFLENVVMKTEWQNIITEHLWIKPLKINSNLLLPHSRPRLYWSNLPTPNIKQKNYLLKDYLDQNFDEKLLISKKLFGQIVLEKNLII